MREVVVDGHAADGAANLHAPLHSAKFGEGLRRACGLDAHVVSRRDCRQCIQHVVLTQQSPLHHGDLTTFKMHGKP